MFFCWVDAINEFTWKFYKLQSSDHQKFPELQNKQSRIIEDKLVVSPVNSHPKLM